VIDQAVGYATIAAGGQRAEPYLVGKVLDGSGHMVYQTDPQAHRAFDAQVAANATYAMEQVLTSGTAAGKGLAGRPAAGKTGTTSKNADAWFVGFTPQLSAAVWMGNPTESEPLTNVPGYEGGVYGGGLPATIWQQFMNAALQGDPVETFPQPSFSGSGAVPQPTSSATASPTATSSASPSSTSSPTPSSTASPTSSPTGQPTQSPTPQPTQSPTTPPSTQSPAPSPTATKQQKNSTVSGTSTSAGTSPSPSAPSG
jgi:membrane peptidoglycan carboxypeptidase